MKTRKLATASILSTSIFLGSLASPVAASFALTDIPDNYARKAIIELSEAGIMKGTGNGKFDPSGAIKRQDFAIVLAKTLNLDLDSAPQSPTFRDVPSISYAFAAIEAAHKAGLLNGMGNSSFGGNQPLTREQMAVIFVKALNVDTAGRGDSLRFTDSQYISPWAKEYVAAAIEHKLMTGNSDGSFNPSGIAIRQDVALVTSKFLTKKSELELEEVEEPSTNPEKEPEQPPVTNPEPSPEQPSPEPNPEPNPNPKPEPQTNAAPTAKDLNFVFEDENTEVTVGKQVRIDYSYEDQEDDQLVSVKFAWYRSSDIEGKDKELIPDSNSYAYTFTTEDVDHYISVEITPIAATGTITGETAYKVLEQVVMEPMPELDTTPPSVDTTKFNVVDNYNGTSDQLLGLESAISEGDAVVRAYPWIDTNNVGVIDEGELSEPIILGVSNADGSLHPSNIGDLDPGDYKFAITAADNDLNESEISSDYTITVSLANGALPTVTSSVYGFDGGELKVKEFVAGSTPYHIRFDYLISEPYSNGTLEVNVEGISFGVEDYYHDGTIWKHFTQDQILNDGQKIIITGISGLRFISFELHNQVIPQEGFYRITFKGDADGEQLGRTPSDEQTITLISVIPEI